MANITTSVSAIPEALGRSDAFLALQERIVAVAKVNRPVVIIGERGTGKELAAIRLHYHSHRWQGPLVAVNCSALSESLLESELFGHEPGAFTGAVRLRRGRFEAAHKGTLFLDEIGTMPLNMQEKILRVAEYQVVERLGGSSPLEVDVRIIAATNADLVALVAQGRFKPDLLDRLAFEVLRIPPLRERNGDAALLAEHFAARMAVELGRFEPPRLSASVVKALETYSWPGNVRELKNVVERAVFRASDATVIKELTMDPFAATPSAGSVVSVENTEQANLLRRPSQSGMTTTHPGTTKEPVFDQISLPEAMDDLERRRLRQALRQARFNQRRAAEILGLRYHQFRGLYRKHRGDLELEGEAGPGE
ncbi:phage shock protein operon transcriptional activator [Desulfonatronum sp. SC1]|uniref:phage shock protein operon transcriptional activator n=1 Tax=Desulfonatronum sp. SC1 TaxID=2109626 RepID=UPI000D31D235|nr:phage shock protein operon transcriptional activator [Desulfonatronum sp. SC1]PTN33190.1 phage shock protein operon transcriptional activator [Desulfonatronum sp. SC1]